MKRILYAFLAFAIATSLGLTAVGHASADSFNSNKIIDDSVFDNTATMNASQIDGWLNSSFPSSCISTRNGFSAPDPTGYNPSQGFLYGGNVSAGQVIYDASQAYNINPQVLLATLQKESSVVSGDASYHCSYINTAMGYGCPDSGSCPTDPATMSGFSKQVIHAAWLFKFGEQRAEGNTSWEIIKGGWDNSDDPGTCYGGPMTQGTLSRGCGQAATYFDGYTTIDGSSVHMDNGATATLYWYTPHFSGNQHFFSIFNSWFSSTYSDGTYINMVRLDHSSGHAEIVGYSSADSYNSIQRDSLSGYPAEPSDGEVIPQSYANSSNISFIRLNHSSGHAEIVTYSLANNYQSAIDYSLTGYPAVAPDGAVKPIFWPNGDLVFVRLNHSSGRVELVSYSKSSGYKQMVNYVLTGYPAVAPDGAVVPLFSPDGNLNFIRLNHSSGHIEIVTYSLTSNYRQVSDYELSAYPAVTPDGSVVPVFMRNGDLGFIRLNHSSGHLEIVTYSKSSGYKQMTSYLLGGYPAVSDFTNVDPLVSQ